MDKINPPKILQPKEEKSLDFKFSTFTSAFISSFLPVKNEHLCF